VWSFRGEGTPRGLALARERDFVLLWHERWLDLLDRRGQRQGRRETAGAVVSACAAEDGSAYGVADSQRELVWLGPDLMPRWHKTMPQPLVALAMDALGQYVAAADQRGGVHLFNQLGQPAGSLQSPRPLHHLAFVAEQTWLVGSADYGLVGSFDVAGRWRWRDGLVVNVGGLAITGDGAQMVLACFSEGLRRYDGDGRPLPALPSRAPCRLVSQAYDGRRLLTAGLSTQVSVLDADGKMAGSHTAEQAVAAIALAALGDYAVIAHSDGTVIAMALRLDP
jgi:hypothetical protein